MEKYKLNRDVTQDECHWLSRTYVKGEEVNLYTGYTYGCISPEGVACCQDDDRFFELPVDALDGLDQPEKLVMDYYIGIEKIESAIGEHPNKINVGYLSKGSTMKLPTVGTEFKIVSMSRMFTTSTVTEVLEQNEIGGIFKTKNSTYKWTIINE